MVIVEESKIKTSRRKYQISFLNTDYNCLISFSFCKCSNSENAVSDFGAFVSVYQRNLIMMLQGNWGFPTILKLVLGPDKILILIHPKQRFLINHVMNSATNTSQMITVPMKTSRCFRYKALIKPSFNPPNYLFGIVWPILYLLMAIAAFAVWTKTGLTKEVSKVDYSDYMYIIRQKSNYN